MPRCYPKRIEPGLASAASQFALSNGAIQCKRVKRAAGDPETPFAIFGFPGATLKLSHGQYGFSKSETQREASPLGAKSPAKFTLKAKVTGVLVNSTTIEGTAKVSGGPCTVAKPIPYVAKVDRTVPVAPGD